MVANNLTKKLTNQDVVVLINGWSASASEIFAGVIKDYVPNSLLLWTQTFGKWSVQNLIEYIDWSMLKYTVAKWYTGKSEKNIDWIGFAPDLKLEDDLKTERDEVLEVAKIYKFK
jgi:carboxyl-terminal processing protease